MKRALIIGWTGCRPAHKGICQAMLLHNRSERIVFKGDGAVFSIFASVYQARTVPAHFVKIPFCFVNAAFISRLVLVYLFYGYMCIWEVCGCGWQWWTTFAKTVT